LLNDLFCYEGLPDEPEGQPLGHGAVPPEERDECLFVAAGQASDQIPVACVLQATDDHGGVMLRPRFPTEGALCVLHSRAAPVRVAFALVRSEASNGLAGLSWLLHFGADGVQRRRVLQAG